MLPFATEPVAILYQAQEPPVIEGIRKPMKPGGYADSGADIAVALRRAGITVLTPVELPDAHRNLDWVFPDTTAGIAAAEAAGARILWLNTVLFAGHPIEAYLASGGRVVGQAPQQVQLFDDKWATNQLLGKHGIPIPITYTLTADTLHQPAPQLSFPVVVKPIRGRGSVGVTVVSDADQLLATAQTALATSEFGETLMVEEFLAGKEVTVSVLPPGTYEIDGQLHTYAQHWCLPPIQRFNHDNGVAPYNGAVAVVHNSTVLPAADIGLPGVQRLYQHCATAARLVGARTLIRIDCRQTVDDPLAPYTLFDLNMKPNLTGSGRPGRQEQDGLTTLAAQAIGWNYPQLLMNLLRQAWSATDVA